MLSNTKYILTGEHMSSEYMCGLSEIEAKVIKILAEEGPKSGYDFHLGGKRERNNKTAIMSSGHWIKVIAHIGPKNLGIIEPITIRNSASNDERGRRKDLYWLSPNGVIVALLVGANQNYLKHNINCYSKENKLVILCDWAEIFGLKKLADMVDFSTDANSEIPVKQLPYLRFKNTSDPALTAFLKTLEAHPDIKAQFKTTLTNARNNADTILKRL